MSSVKTIDLWDDIKVRLKQSDLDQSNVDVVIEQFEYARVPQLYFDVPYGCCMSYVNDLVQQWREYGDKGKGLSIGFDLEWFNIKNHLPSTTCSVASSIGYSPVIYDSPKLRDDFYQLFYDGIKEEGKSAWILSILPTFKHYAGIIKNHTFCDEREIRILFYPSEHFTDSLAGLSDLQKDIRPHYCLNWADNASNAMRSITLGYECEHSMEDIKRLVETAELAYKDRVTISQSACSYQDRR